MFDKLMEAKKKADEIKTKLGAIKVVGEAGNKGVSVTVDGNKKICDIAINDDLMNVNRKEELQDTLMVAIENAMEQAENISSSEMKSLLGNMMPGLGNMFGQ